MAWLPVLKTVLPYVANIVTTAIPVFTSKRDQDQAALVAQQIAELQSAAKGNAESVRLLAEQLQRTIEGLEAAAAAAERSLLLARRLALAAAILAIAACVLSLVALLAH